MRFLWVSIGLAVLLLIPFLIWEDALNMLFSHDAMVSWLKENQGWGWLGGIALLIADLLLPIPGTVVMSALGYVYGPLVGGIVSASGSFLSGLVAYTLCRKTGKKAALWLVGKNDLAKGERLFSKSGGWIVALSRSLPLLSEVIACLAGIAKMPARRFALSLACGSVPFGFAFAWIGSLGGNWPRLALALSLLIPPILWLIVGKFFRERRPDGEVQTPPDSD